MSDKYAFCLDFDCTITKHHSGGHPKIGVDVFDPEISSKKISGIFAHIRSLGHKIFIVSRGIENEIVSYLDHHKIIVDKVYGARDEAHLAEGTIPWTSYKSAFLKTIRDENKDHQVFFFDDTAENVVQAILDDFDSIHVPSKLGPRFTFDTMYLILIGKMSSVRELVKLSRVLYSGKMPMRKHMCVLVDKLNTLKNVNFGDVMIPGSSSKSYTFCFSDLLKTGNAIRTFAKNDLMLFASGVFGKYLSYTTDDLITKKEDYWNGKSLSIPSGLYVVTKDPTSIS